MHLCNTFFELELEGKDMKSVSDWLQCHFMVRKFQYLPLRYAKKGEAVLVLDMPENPDPRLCSLHKPPRGVVETWGASLAVNAWAKKHGIGYRMPPWEVVKRVNSKVFSFEMSPKLPGSALLKSVVDAQRWIEESGGPKVLKTPQGFAGRGHFHVGSKGLDSFLKQHPEVIGEPWVERTFDFSTQWNIDRGIEYLGSTVLINKNDGTYLANRAQSDFGKYNWALFSHLEIVKPVLQRIEKLGYFGNLGIDAFVYWENGKEKLHPIVEINARKTMGWVVLQEEKNSH